MKKSFLLLFAFCCTLLLFAQPQVQLIKVSVVPDSQDWNYALNKKAKFDISVTQSGIPVKDIEIRYELSFDMMPPFKTATIILKDGKTQIEGGSMKTPGFLRCRVFANYNGKEYEGRGTAGFAPEILKPTTEMPADFLEFWKKAKADNEKIPMDAKLRLLPERCTANTNVYELNFQNFRAGSRMYGILCVPKAPGKYPALLRVPGAGVRPYSGDVKNADRGMITLDMGIHGIPVTMEQGVYDDLRAGALQMYSTSNFDNKDNVYYKRVYLGCVRAVDYIFSLPEFDGDNIVVYGGSQGGALSVTTAMLDQRIRGSICFYPALADMTGYLHDRAGGWPHIFRNNNDVPAVLAEKVKTSGYYDVVNFARLLKAPIFFGFGYNDMVCPPTSTYSVYNVITSPKTLCVVPEIEHYTYPEMWDAAWKWADGIIGR
jgi:cephalosporin-C deacetylase-like acetyl esterase